MAEENNYQAIVVGGGMSGSWAVKELCDVGIKTLLLERGPEIVHLRDYPTAAWQPWDAPHRNQLSHEMASANPIASKCYAFKEPTTQHFVKDAEHPYIQEAPFDWLRGYQIGGKSLMWARQVQRWSNQDFEGPKRDNYAVDWPIRYTDLDKWYTHVEHFIGVSGNKDGLESLPDGDFLPAMEANCMEQHFMNFVKENYPDRQVIKARCAHITEQREIHRQQGRGQCQHRMLCERGCPFGGYFSANSSTIPWAKRTGNLTIRPHSVVHSVIYDHNSGEASGVKVIDANTKEELIFNAKVIFVNASTINTNLLLLNSKSERFPNGLGNDSGTLGKYIAFHNYRPRVTARSDQFSDKRTSGRSIAGSYIPRFVNFYKNKENFKRGYAVGIYTDRIRRTNTEGVGQQLIDNILSDGEWGPWYIGAHMMGETIPKESNYVALDKNQKDEWGMPLLRINVTYDENDQKMMDHFYQTFTEMFKKAGFSNIETIDDGRNPGNDIHEMGGARMGHNPKTSVLNEWNQMHACKNVYVTDGACMTSTSTQNPSLTYMAIAARAANHAAEIIKNEL
jgi:choline dehydrogenase-like flavoprotein